MITPVRTIPPAKITSLTSAELDGMLRAFEEENKVDATTWLEAFRDEAGELHEREKFFEVSAMYALRGKTG